MQNIVIKQLILNPTFEVMAKVNSNPLIKVIPETGWAQWVTIITMILAPIIAAIVAYGLTINYQNRSRKSQEDSVRVALKYELYYNFYEIISLLKRIKGVKTALLMDNKLVRFLHVEPLFSSFDSMISSNLLSAINKEEEIVFSIYTILRQYNLLSNKSIIQIEELYEGIIKLNLNLSIPDEIKNVLFEKYDSLTIAIEKIREQFEKQGGYIDKISFLNRDEWEKFKTQSPV
jgi:hypothetical protein